MRPPSGDPDPPPCAPLPPHQALMDLLRPCLRLPAARTRARLHCLPPPGKDGRFCRASRLTPRAGGGGYPTRPCPLCSAAFSGRDEVRAGARPLPAPPEEREQNKLSLLLPCYSEPGATGRARAGLEPGQPGLHVGGMKAAGVDPAPRGRVAARCALRLCSPGAEARGPTGEKDTRPPRLETFIHVWLKKVFSRKAQLGYGIGCNITMSFSDKAQGFKESPAFSPSV